MGRKHNTWGRSPAQLLSQDIAAEFYTGEGAIRPVAHEITRRGVRFTVDVPDSVIFQFLRTLEDIQPSVPLVKEV